MGINNIFLSIIIPLYNEESRIHHLKKIITYLNSQNFNSEIIIVNDGSQDKTVKKLNKYVKIPYIKLISYKINKGKGYAIKKGMLKAIGKWRLFVDIDQSTPIKMLNTFFKSTENFAVLVGSRRAKNSKIITHQPYVREVFGRLFTKYSQILLKSNISDFTCGFKLFRYDSAHKLFSKAKINRWGFDSEIIFLAHKYNYSIREVPVEWKNDPYSRVRFPRDIFLSLFEIIQIRYYDLLKKY